jgi:hypothetical protein
MVKKINIKMLGLREAILLLMKICSNEILLFSWFEFNKDVLIEIQKYNNSIFERTNIFEETKIQLYEDSLRLNSTF